MIQKLSVLKSIGSFFLMALLLSACSTNKSKLEEKQAALYFGAGTQSLMDGQYTEALKSLLMANKLDPKNSDIVNNLGMAYYFKGEKDLAINHLKLALEYNKNNSDAKINLASIYFKDGKIEDAEKIYKDVLKDLTYDKQARTYYNLGVIESQSRKNLVAAENYFKKSIEEDDNYCPGYYQLGLVQFQRRQFNSALRNLKESTLGSCYEAPAPHYYQALALIELHRFDEARLKLEEIDTRFKKSVFAAKARTKAVEINDIENRFKSTDMQASRKVLESPDF